MHTAANLERAAKRWSVFHKAVKAADKRALAGEVLDVGCGRGEFVRVALESGVRASGLDVNEGGIEKFRGSVKDEWKTACSAYTGGAFPFESGRFSAIHSWFVFEHLERPHETICEISRIAARGCILVLNAQDGRTLVEAHANIPWLPFLPLDLRSAWLSTLVDEERKNYILDCVFPTTADDVVGALRFFGWQILEADLRGDQGSPPVDYPGDIPTTNEAARRAKSLAEAGSWPTQPLNYRVVARRSHI